MVVAEEVGGGGWEVSVEGGRVAAAWGVGVSGERIRDCNSVMMAL